MKLDATDLKLIEILQEDCKLTTKQIAAELSLSVTAAYERVRKLEREGVVDKYVAIINREKVDRAFKVFCHIKLTQHNKNQVFIFEDEVKELEEVSECYHISGKFDYLLKVNVKDMPAYREFMLNKLTKLNYVDSTHSVFVIGNVKKTTAVKL